MATKPVKVAFFSYMPLMYWGGLEKWLTKTSRELTDRYPDLHIDVITTDPRLSRKIHFWHGLYFGQLPGQENLERESLDSILAQLGPRVAYRRAASFRELKQMLREYDVIYSKNELIEAFILKFRIGYRNLPPVIFGCHTAIYYPSGSSGAAVHNFLYGGFIYRNLADGVSTFQALNESDGTVLKRRFAGKRVSVIPNPFDFDEFTKQAEDHPLKLQLPGGKLHILWVGRLSLQKGVDDLISLISNLGQGPEGNRVSWTIAGDGPLQDKVLTAAETWNNITYLGHVDGHAMSSLYGQHDLLLSTSKWEGFPYTLIEAQCVGLPVIAYDIPGCKDIIDTGKNGQLVSDLPELAKEVRKAVQGHKFKSDIRSYIRAKLDTEKIYGSLASLISEAIPAKS